MTTTNNNIYFKSFSFYNVTLKNKFKLVFI